MIKENIALQLYNEQKNTTDSFEVFKKRILRGLAIAENRKENIKSSSVADEDRADFNLGLQYNIMVITSILKDLE